MYYLVLSLTLALALSGCGRQGDPSKTPGAETAPAAGQVASDAMKQPTEPGPDNPTANPPDQTQAPSAGSATLCTPEWFAWVQQQVITQQDGDLKKMYPSGLPPVGSEEWFAAVTKLTGGNLNDVKPGSPEWCQAIQKRLSQPDSQGQ
ncbi:hypothetical protein ACCI51_04050 [Microbulbifer echini]|uniref:Lipoprotein n=1 Tax=Microbulbifer echini TaxID=1529067 RepID=A0ABV4NL26_9GAMM